MSDLVPRSRLNAVEMELAAAEAKLAGVQKNAAAEIERLQKALHGWLIEHGGRCRICSERSQNALQGRDNDWAHETSEAL